MSNVVYPNEELIISTPKLSARSAASTQRLSSSGDSEKTSSVIMEILGMEKSFQKTYSDSEFIEIVPFPNPPKYGWPIHPVVFEIEHEELGHIQLKTEIHPLGEPVPPVIYSRP